MIRLITIASSSKSNAWAVDYDGSVLLFDCGVTKKALITELEKHSLSLKNITAVFITHSHSDHTKGIPVLSKAINVPFYSAVDVDGCEKIEGPVTVNGITVSFFTCSHDVPCVGYRLDWDKNSICFATDSGVVTDGMRESLYGCHTVVLESNHDIDMLKCGPYPPTLKARIASDCGHLSNKACGECLVSIAEGGLKRCILAHLSETNNYPLMARSTVTRCLSNYGITDIEILTADAGTEVII